MEEEDISEVSNLVGRCLFLEMIFLSGKISHNWKSDWDP